MGILDLFRGSKEERIARRYMKALREAGESRPMIHIPAEGIIAVLDEKGERCQVAHLGNLQRELDKAAEPDHEAIYQRYAANHAEIVAADTPRDYAAARPTLRLLLKDETYLPYIELQTMADMPGGNPPSYVYEHVVGDVIACCVEERTHGLSFVTTKHLQTWGVSAEQVLKDAKANVCSLSSEIHASSPVNFVFADDSFQSARLVNTDLFRDLPVRGAWVAVVPDRNTYFLSNSEDLEGLAGLARLAEKQCAEGDRLVSGTPFVLHDGTWQVFEPPGAVRVLFDNVARRFAETRWTDYREVLQKDLEKRGDPAFVASLKVYRHDESPAYWSEVVWSKGVDTILPVADRVVFYEGEGLPLRSATWANVLRVMEPAMLKLDGLPIRFRVNTFPTPEQMVAIGAQQR